MSIPISKCLIIKAGRGDEHAYARLLSYMRTNIQFGSYSVFPCEHMPKCEPLTRKQAKALDARMEEDLAEPEKKHEDRSS